jgi:hypothetical protein
MKAFACFSDIRACLQESMLPQSFPIAMYPENNSGYIPLDT